MQMKTRIKIAVTVLLCSVTAVISFTAVFSSMKAGDVSMIGNEHTKAFSTEFTELVPCGKDEDSLSWFDGMVTGNGENAKINMPLSLQACWSLRGFGNSGEKDIHYKKLVDDGYENASVNCDVYCIVFKGKSVYPLLFLKLLNKCIFLGQPCNR